MDKMSATISKFTFGIDMSRNEQRSKVLTSEQIDEMVAAARREGFAEGERGEQARLNQALLASANLIADKCVVMVQARDEIQKLAIGEAVQLGSQVGRKLAHNLIAQQPEIELTALITECLSSLEDAPHLVIRCHPDLADAIRDTTEERIKTSSFSGRLVIMGDPDIALSDGRIEWANGGLVRDHQAIGTQIDEAISEYLRANGITVAEENEQ